MPQICEHDHVCPACWGGAECMDLFQDADCGLVACTREPVVRARDVRVNDRVMINTVTDLGRVGTVTGWKTVPAGGYGKTRRCVVVDLDEGKRVPGRPGPVAVAKTVHVLPSSVDLIGQL